MVRGPQAGESLFIVDDTALKSEGSAVPISESSPHSDWHSKKVSGVNQACLHHDGASFLPHAIVSNITWCRVLFVFLPQVVKVAIFPDQFVVVFLVAT